MSADSALKIAIVSTQRKWYGGEEEVYLLAQGLRRRGHGVHILARRGGILAGRMKTEGFAVGEFAGNGRNPLGLWQICRQLRRLRPDVLQYNDSHALTAAGLASWGLEIPVRIAMRHVSLPIRSPWRFRVFGDRVVCVSHAVADVCRDSGLPPEKLRVVFAVTDPERIRAGNRRQGRAAAGVSGCEEMGAGSEPWCEDATKRRPGEVPVPISSHDDRPMILVVASLNEHKGHAFLLEAMPTVFARHPDVSLVLAGDGPQREPLQLQAKQLGLDDRVRFLGYRRDVPDLIRAADLLVLPSFAGEGLPVTLLDAMFAGVPFVTTAIGGVADITGEIVEKRGLAPSSDAKTPRNHVPARCLSPFFQGSEPVAWVVPPRNSPALAAAILDALDHPDERVLRANRARQRAERLFTPDQMVDAMLEVYREVLERKNGVV